MKKIELKQEALKEVGKLFFDAFKIVIAISIITPLAKEESIGILPFILSIPLVVIGIYLTNKGAKE